MNKIQSWGRLTNNKHRVISLINSNSVINQINLTSNKGISHGMGRSYGDVALNRNNTIWLTTQLNHFISFNLKTGILQCEAGVILQDIQRSLLPQGWLLPVTPGTQMITVGGAIANDIHGKNHHHFGSFGDHLISIKLVRTNGEVINCSRLENPEWFFATLGGIGLTGVIVEATLQLRAIEGGWIEAETVPYYSLNDFFTLSDQSIADWEHSVSWIDCVQGKEANGLFIRGNFAKQQHQYPHLPTIQDKTFPISPPFSLVNRLSLPLFNFAYFHNNKRKTKTQRLHYEKFFYPLDALQQWNKMYGKKGFYQYQCVVPRHIGQEAIHEMLKVIKKSGEGSFLAVLKTFGDRESGGLLSFPRSGVTLALDFPNRGDKTLKLFNELDRITAEAEGRLYLAKDTRMSRDLFEMGYPRFNEFFKYIDPGISSEMSRRLLGV
ncbi:FAD-binding oxidoreductase [Acinetobacter rudis]|uniref:FAD-binding oxidoreductase n=1 Tax=Acinetobacter rudis TaxID=632955 RepID=A0AAW8J537_9GAMM|nr:FAD-binding oxidoreductase [Acinetobacter rudis]MDQ8935161.1 FAD-binding oxidoreductase [Acinetobacter rudis]MDQ9017029.1 FAD-binding oxidoreductase [Acinetobacter rudis]